MIIYKKNWQEAMKVVVNQSSYGSQIEDTVIPLLLRVLILILCSSAHLKRFNSFSGFTKKKKTHIQHQQKNSIKTSAHTCTIWFILTLFPNVVDSSITCGVHLEGGMAIYK